MATSFLAGQGPAIYLLIFASLALVVYAAIAIVRSPDLTTGARWGWGLALAFGFGLFWFPGVIVAAAFLLLKGRRRQNQPR